MTRKEAIAAIRVGMAGRKRGGDPLPRRLAATWDLLLWGEDLVTEAAAVELAEHLTKERSGT